MLKWLLLLHVLGASIWVGGHLILSLGVLPKALKEQNLSIILDFESRYERIGIPALIIQIVTGLMIANIYVPIGGWLSLDTVHHRFLWIKLGLLVSTLALAIHARLFIIPRITKEKLPLLAFHIILTTVVAVFFVIAGLSFRFNYL